MSHFNDEMMQLVGDETAPLFDYLKSSSRRQAELHEILLQRWPTLTARHAPMTAVK